MGPQRKYFGESMEAVITFFFREKKVGGTSEHKVTCNQVYRQWHRRIAPSFLWAFLGRFPDEIFGILFSEFLNFFKQGKVTKAQVDTTTVYQKKYPSTGIPCIAVRVLGLNKSFWKVFYGWIYNPYNWFTQPRARRARARRARNNPPALQQLFTLQYTYCILGSKKINTWRARGAAARVSVNFRKFSPCIARARGARVRVWQFTLSLGRWNS